MTNESSSAFSQHLTGCLSSQQPVASALCPVCQLIRHDLCSGATAGLPETPESPGGSMIGCLQQETFSYFLFSSHSNLCHTFNSIFLFSFCRLLVLGSDVFLMFPKAEASFKLSAGRTSSLLLLLLPLVSSGAPADGNQQRRLQRRLWSWELQRDQRRSEVQRLPTCCCCCWFLSKHLRNVSSLLFSYM